MSEPLLLTELLDLSELSLADVLALPPDTALGQAVARVLADVNTPDEYGEHLPVARFSNFV